MDNPTCVFQDSSHTNRHPSDSESQQSQLDSPNSHDCASITQQVRPIGMQIIRKHLQKSGLSPDVVNVLMSSWRQSTCKQYSVYINKWVHFCGEQKIDPLHPSVTWVLQFLQSLLGKGLGYSALNTARSAISSLDVNAVLNHTTPVGQHPLVCRYLKGVFNHIKPVPKYHTIWPVEKVLRYLKTLWPLEKFTIKELTFKLVMLIVLTTGQRCQTLTCLDTSQEYMKKHDDCYDFALTEHLKQDRPTNVFGNLRLYKYFDPELCVYGTLQYYLIVTTLLRISTKLLVSYIKPYNPVTSSTIGRWIKTVLQKAGINTQIFSAHSTRSASTSKAVTSVSADVVLKTAGWSEESIFRRFYKRPVAITDQMSKAVLE